jgi:predicted dehydrogenase
MHILIIGVGSIGERHLRNFLRLEDITCSIAEPSERLRQRLCADHEVADAYTDWREADCTAFDGVVICTPTDLHVPIMDALLDAGVNVLSEKPVAMQLAGVPELVEKANATDVVSAVAFCNRHNPLMEEISRRVRAGDLGTVKAASYYGGQYWPDMRNGWPPEYARKRETGGGAIPDHLVHQVNLLEWFLGPVESVCAFQRHMDLEGIETEDYANVVLRFAGGQAAELTLCLFQRDFLTRLQIVGTGGTIRNDHGDDRLDVFEASTGQWSHGDARAVDRDDLFLLQAKHFVDCIRGEAKPRCTVEEAAQTLRVILAAIESSDTDSRFITP